MAQIGTQQTKVKCPQCGQTFNSTDELRKHQENCRANAAADNAGSAKPEKNAQKVETDMEIEDRFEASDN